MIYRQGVSLPSTPRKRPLWRRLIWPSRWWSRVIALTVYALVALMVIGILAGHKDGDNASAQRCYRWDTSKNAAHSKEAVPSEVTRAYRLITDCYFEPPDSELLLTAAWDAAHQAATKAGSEPSDTPLPSFTGSYDKDTALFDDAFASFVAELKGRVPEDRLVWAAIGGMTASLKDAHTSYLPPAYWTKSMRSGKNETPDAGFSYVYRKEGILVWEVIKGSSADQGGMRAGDLITGINDTPIYSYSSTQPAAIDTPIAYTVQRQGGVEAQVSLHLEHLRPRMTTTELEKDIAYVRLNTFFAPLSDFQRTSDPELKALQADAPAGWILDLRGNSGGSSVLAQHVAQALGLKGDLASYQDRYHAPETDREVTRSLTDGKPVVVLVDEQSVSASEIVAGAMQDGGVAHIIGARTAGHANGTGEAYTVAGGGLIVTEYRVFVSSSHRSLEDSGVVPDEDIRLTPEALADGHDAQLERAIAYIRSKQAAATTAR